MSEFNLNPIINESTQEKAYRYLKDAILNKEISNDQVFTEVQLAKSLNISRTPVRAAVQDLIKEGLLESIPRKGLIVRNLTKSEQEEIYLLRRSVEAIVIEKLSTSITSTQIEELYDIYNEQKVALEDNDGVKFIELDQKFHIKLVQFSGLKLVESILLNLHNLTQLMGLKAISKRGRMKSVLDEHIEIIEALKQSDSVTAKECMIKHLNTTYESLSTEE